MSATQPKKKSGRTLFALGLGYLIDQGEAQAMSVLSPIIQNLWGVSYGMLGLMTTLRNITQTISAPFWGYAADKYSRKKVLVFGTGIWGIWTIVVGLMPSFTGVLIIRAISGLGLGCLMPATFSLLGDHFPQEKRGKALGVIGFVGLMGTVVGVLALGFVATPELWRWGFVGLGVFSILSGLIIWWLVEEPPRGAAEPELAGLMTYADEERYSINWKDVVGTLRIPTIWAAILQGITGTMPWVVMGFYFINWMVNELGFINGISFSDPKGSAPLMFAVVVVGAAISNFMGGVIGDWAEKKNPNYGRTIIGQISVFAGVPTFYYILTRAHEMSLWRTDQPDLCVGIIDWLARSRFKRTDDAGCGAAGDALQCVFCGQLYRGRLICFCWFDCRCIGRQAGVDQSTDLDGAFPLVDLHSCVYVVLFHLSKGCGKSS